MTRIPPNRPRHDDHLVKEAHIPHYKAQQAGTATCRCGHVSTAMPDALDLDPWEPLVAAHRAHRLSVGIRPDAGPKERRERVVA